MSAICLQPPAPRACCVLPRGSWGSRALRLRPGNCHGSRCLRGRRRCPLCGRSRAPSGRQPSRSQMPDRDCVPHDSESRVQFSAREAARRGDRAGERAPEAARGSPSPHRPALWGAAPPRTSERAHSGAHSQQDARSRPKAWALVPSAKCPPGDRFDRVSQMQSPVLRLASRATTHENPDARVSTHGSSGHEEAAALNPLKTGFRRFLENLRKTCAGARTAGRRVARRESERPTTSSHGSASPCPPGGHSPEVGLP